MHLESGVGDVSVRVSQPAQAKPRPTHNTQHTTHDTHLHSSYYNGSAYPKFIHPFDIAIAAFGHLLPTLITCVVA